MDIQCRELVTDRMGQPDGGLSVSSMLRQLTNHLFDPVDLCEQPADLQFMTKSVLHRGRISRWPVGQLRDGLAHIVQTDTVRDEHGSRNRGLVAQQCKPEMLRSNISVAQVLGLACGEVERRQHSDPTCTAALRQRVAQRRALRESRDLFPHEEPGAAVDETRGRFVGVGSRLRGCAAMTRQPSHSINSEGWWAVNESNPQSGLFEVVDGARLLITSACESGRGHLNDERRAATVCARLQPAA
jgi:hypothetical protein